MRLSSVTAAFSAAFDLFLPRKCRLCGALLAAHEQHVCTGCISSLARTGFAAMSLNPMEQRFVGYQGTLVKAVSPFFYEKEGGAAHLIHTLKYAGIKGLGTWLGVLTARELLPYGWFADADMLVPVPLHRIKRWQRGFNQSMEICRGIARETDLPIVDCLQMRHWQGAQARRSRTERWLRRKGAYSVKPGMYRDLAGKHLVIVDDVCTTGSTLQAIVQELSKIPNVKVSLLTVSVAH